MRTYFDNYPARKGSRSINFNLSIFYSRCIEIKSTFFVRSASRKELAKEASPHTLSNNLRRRLVAEFEVGMSRRSAVMCTRHLPPIWVRVFRDDIPGWE